MDRKNPDEITRLLHRWAGGDPEAAASLWPLVHDEVRRLAAHHFRAERQGHTLQPTAVVHEVYLKLLGQREIQWRDKAHFMGACAQVIRRILVDHARGRQAVKRGGEFTRVTLDKGMRGPLASIVDALDLDGALRRLKVFDRRQERIVELRFFSGLSVDEVAAVMDISPATVKREWAMARAWLYQELCGES